MGYKPGFKAFKQYVLKKNIVKVRYEALRTECHPQCSKNNPRLAQKGVRLCLYSKKGSG